MPLGCISAADLRALADAVEGLESWHVRHGGPPGDHPCLRRLESSAGTVLAHVSVGKPVGGHWEVLELTQGAWRLRIP